MILIGKVPFYCLELRVEKKRVGGGGEESITWVLLLLPFWTILEGFPSLFWIILASSTSWQQM